MGESEDDDNNTDIIPKTRTASAIHVVSMSLVHRIEPEASSRVSAYYDDTTQPRGSYVTPAPTMCITNVFVDRYPDGKETSFRQTTICQYGRSGQPCQRFSIFENPVRKVQFGEPTTEYMMTARLYQPQHEYQSRTQFPQTPPRSSGGSPYRRSGEYSSEESARVQRRDSSSRRRSELPLLRPTRIHRKERIIIVESPPTPRTPPQTFRTFTAPSSPASPAYIFDSALPRQQERERGRPVIVDERPHLRHARVPSIGAVVGERPVLGRARSPISRIGRNAKRDSGIFQWESPSTSHTSFDSRARREAEEVERLRVAEREQRIAALEADRRREQRIREQDEEIRRRPTVPLPSQPQPLKSILKPVAVDPSLALMGGLQIRDRDRDRDREWDVDRDRLIVGASEMRRRVEERERVARRAVLEREEEEEEDMKRRLRERQMPKRRFSVGPGNRRHRVLYDDGVYRWE
ncbi:hypothetical protein LZ554_000318 [Drepanopeziza brunnea f. sp. 'monogermtubi']|nr:hypothetical protein LZ554_000318 [Drepanopeziza brunnea f. sp. 'monogermtubi']